MLVAVSPTVPKTPLWRWMDEADRYIHTACHGQRQGTAAFGSGLTHVWPRPWSQDISEQMERMRSCIRHLFRVITQCHDGIRASGSYQHGGVLRLCLCQSFRKPVRPFARHVLNIRRGRKNSLLVSQFLAYAITGRYSSFFASKFQMILAVLLARATAAICLPRRVATP